MKKLINLLFFAFVFTSCNDSEDVVITNAGTLRGGPFIFLIDGKVDNVSGITVEGNIQGTNTSFIIADETGVILELPPDLTNLQRIDFDTASIGKCYILHIAYENDVSGLEVGKSGNDLTGNFDLSNNIEISREKETP